MLRSGFKTGREREKEKGWGRKEEKKEGGGKVKR